MNFQKSSRGAGGIFNPKIHVAGFGNFKQNKTHFEEGTSKFPAPLPLEREERTVDVSDSDIVELQSLLSAQENQRRNILKEFLN